MSIAQIYQYLQTTDFFTRGTSTVQRNTILYDNPIYRFTSKTEAQEYYMCMSLPHAVLSNAHYRWALELSYLVKMRASEEVVTWLTNELSNGYRRGLKHIVQKTMPCIINHIDQYRGHPLGDAIQLAIGQAMQEDNNRRGLGGMAAPAADNGLPVPPPVIPADILLTMRSNHAQANGCLSIAVNIPGESITKNFFLQMDKYPQLLALFSQPAEDDDPACNICMIEQGIYGCGHSCTYQMCNNCFHEWFCKNPKCPACAREYIPLPLQRGAATGH